jgi:ribokinase
VRTERWPEPGETMLGRDFLMISGGKGANVAYLARRLGVPALLIGRVGDDPLAGQALRPLEDAGVDLRQVKRVKGESTAISMITVRGDGEKAIVLATNANDSWDEDDARRAGRAIAEAPAGSLLLVDLEVSAAVVRRALDAARKRGFPVVLDPSPAERATDDLLREVDYVTPNPPEAHGLTGIDVTAAAGAEQAGRALLERGVRVAFMKLGNGGCVVVDRAGSHTIAARKVNVVDKTGAGDAFAGALAVALLEGRVPVEAGEFAVAAATFAVTGWGSQPSYPTREQIRQYQPEPNHAARASNA